MTVGFEENYIVTLTRSLTRSRCSSTVGVYVGFTRIRISRWGGIECEWVFGCGEGLFEGFQSVLKRERENILSIACVL